MITIYATDKLPTIEWEICDLIEYDLEERMEVFDALGKDRRGNSYSGSAYYFAGEFEEIKDIEKL